MTTPTASRAAEQPPLTVYTEESAVTRLKNGALSGYLVDVIQEMMRRADARGDIQVLPWCRAYAAAMENPNVLLFPTSRTPEREELFYWLAPIVKTQWILYKRKGSPIELHSLEDARRVSRIAVYREDARHQFLMEKGFTNLEVVNQPELGWRMLQSGRVDLFAGTNAPLTERGQYQQLNVEDLSTALIMGESTLHPVLSKGTSHAVVTACTNAMQEMTADGTIAKLWKKWFTNFDRCPVQ